MAKIDCYLLSVCVTFEHSKFSSKLMSFYFAGHSTGTVYPMLKFFKSGLNSSVTHRGNRDLDTLITFINAQLGKQTEKVRTKIYLNLYPF